MALMMLLAHLVGDYVLQWDRLARWKSRALSGVLVHGGIVLAVTLLLTFVLDPRWWPWALGIGLAHTAIDAAKIPLQRRYSALSLFVADQVAHVALIAIALAASTDLAPVSASVTRLLAFANGYVFVTLPAWIFAEFFTYGLLYGSAPGFTYRSHKYVGSIERTLVTTCVVAGQFALIPVVALPRLLTGPRTTLYRVEWAIGLGLALLTGAALTTC